MIEFNNIFYISFTTFFLSSFIIYVFNKNDILIDQVSYSKHKKLKKLVLKNKKMMKIIHKKFYLVKLFLVARVQ